MDTTKDPTPLPIQALPSLLIQVLPLYQCLLHSLSFHFPSEMSSKKKRTTGWKLLTRVICALITAYFVQTLSLFYGTGKGRSIHKGKNNWEIFSLTLISLTLAGSVASSVVESSEDLREYWPLLLIPADLPCVLPNPARGAASAMVP